MKYVIGAVLLIVATFGGVIFATLSRRVRDVCFVLMVFFSPMSELVDINFVSREWYRGTTCGFEVSIVDVLATSLLVSLIFRPQPGAKRFFWPASLGLILLMFVYGALSVAVNEPRLFGYFELHKMIRGITIFLATAFYVRSERELRVLLFALGAVACFEGLYALKQRYHEGIHRVFGTIDAANSLSIFFLTTTPVFVAAINSRLPKYLKLLGGAAIALAFVAVVLTISRTGIVVLALVVGLTTLMTMSYKITVRKVLIGVLVLIGAAGIGVKSWKTLNERFSESTLKDEYGNKRAMGRGYYIRVATTIAKERWCGVGLNNWSYWVSNKYGPKLGFPFVAYYDENKWPNENIPPGSGLDEAQAAPAHSLGALTLGEMGIGALIILLFMWVRWFQMGATFLWPRTTDPMRRIGVGIFFGTWGIFFQSLTEWVFRQSPIYFTYHILLGALASLYYMKKRAAKNLETPEAEPEYDDVYEPARVQTF
jgi:hypothetical protein